MGKNSKKKGCLGWLSSSTDKRQDRKVVTRTESDSVAVVRPILMTSQEQQELPTTKKEHQEKPMTRAESREIPQEHDEFLEMLFPAGRIRSRTLTASIHAPERRRMPPSDALRFRDRTNSSMSSRRYPMIKDLLLLSMVPTTPVGYSPEFTATLPTPGRSRDRGEMGFMGRNSDWPDYMWRLQQKKQQRCQCSGCEDASASRAPVSPGLGPFFDNESYYNTHDFLKVLKSDGDKEPKKRRTLSKSSSYDVPSPRDASILCNRHAVEEAFFPHPRDRNSAMPSLTYFGSPSKCRHKGLEQIIRDNEWRCESMSEIPVGLHRRQSEQYERPSRQVKGVSFASELMPRQCKECFGGRPCRKCLLSYEDWPQRKPVKGRRFSERKWSTDEEESGYVQSDVITGLPVHEGPGFDACSATPNALASFLDCFVPSNIKNVEGRKGCFPGKDCGAFDGDYLMPCSSFPVTQRTDEKLNNFEACKTGGYLDMNASNSPANLKLGAVAASVEHPQMEKKTETEIEIQGAQPPEDHTKEDTEEVTIKVEALVQPTSCNDSASNSAEENVGGQQQKKGDDCLAKADDLKETDKSVECEGKDQGNNENNTAEISISSLPNDVDKKIMTSSLAEKKDEERKDEEERDEDEMPVKQNHEKQDKYEGKVIRDDEASAMVDGAYSEFLIPPPLAVRMRSQLELLNMSPPPRCGFMIDHTYMNVTRTGDKNGMNQTGSDDTERKQGYSNHRTSSLAHDIIDELSEMAVSKPAYKYPVSQQNGYFKKPRMPYFALYQKSGNDYCQASYLPTLQENLMCTMQFRPENLTPEGNVF